MREIEMIQVSATSGDDPVHGVAQQMMARDVDEFPELLDNMKWSLQNYLRAVHGVTDEPEFKVTRYWMTLEDD